MKVVQYNIGSLTQQHAYRLLSARKNKTCYGIFQKHFSSIDVILIMFLQKRFFSAAVLFTDAQWGMHSVKLENHLKLIP